MQQHLYNQLKEFFNTTHLEVINESNNHSGPATDSHFKLIVVSADFDGVSLINRHRQINQLFREELQEIHAMAMHTYTPKEWESKTNAPKSPKCSSK